MFDAAIPGINAFDANGFWSHNCGEQPLPPYGACLLGSVNLARFVEQPFTREARLDAGRLAAIVPDAVRMLDNVIDISGFPLPAQQEEARNKRRIGLGVTGLADALILCGLRYGSPEAVAATEFMARDDPARGLSRLDRACRREGRVPAVRPGKIPRRRNRRRRSTPTCATRSQNTASATRC